MEYIMKRLGLENEVDVISKMHGKSFKIKTNWGETHVIPLYHPAGRSSHQMGTT